MAEWNSIHSGHGDAVKSYPEPQPRAYRLYRLTCPCGASIMGVEEPE